MHRRPLGNGRRLALLGAIIIVVGSVLPWYTLGGDGGLPPLIIGRSTGPASSPSSPALATLALVALPYAAGERPMAVDRGLAFGLLAVLALIGLILFLPNAIDAPEGLLPDRGYGFWITLVGAIVLGRAAYDISLEPPHR